MPKAIAVNNPFARPPGSIAGKRNAASASAPGRAGRTDANYCKRSRGA
jgi:hypothetical protein